MRGIIGLGQWEISMKLSLYKSPPAKCVSYIPLKTAFLLIQVFKLMLFIDPSCVGGIISTILIGRENRIIFISLKTLLSSRWSDIPPRKFVPCPSKGFITKVNCSFKDFRNKNEIKHFHHSDWLRESSNKHWNLSWVVWWRNTCI